MLNRKKSANYWISSCHTIMTGAEKIYSVLQSISLTIKEIENILQTVKSDKDFQSMGKKEQASVIAKLLQDIAAPKGIELKLRKK